MDRRREEEADDAEGDAHGAQADGYPYQRRGAGDDRRRGEHDRDLDRGRGELVVVVGRGGGVALLLRLLRALGELVAALVGLRLRLVALGGLFPFLDLFFRFITGT